jgi:hypothetical protein
VISLHPAARDVEEAAALVHVYQPYVYVIGCVPINVPAFTLIQPPARIELGTVGSVALVGGDGGSGTADVVAEYRATEPAEFVAVSATRRYMPASASTGV